MVEAELGRLREREIRLLRLPPLRSLETPQDASNDHTTQHEDLQIELVRSSIDEPPRYTCISYTWGSDEQNQALRTTAGDTLPVTANVISILQRLRPSTDEADATLFWIDQISINQNDEDEKLCQIRMMQEIYSKAAKTVVILATLDNEYDELFRRLNGTDIRPYRGDYNFWTSLFKYVDSETVHTVVDTWTRPVIARLISDRVFSRIWIYQEITSSAAVYLCGPTQRIDLDVFASAFAINVRIDLEEYQLAMSNSSRTSVPPLTGAGVTTVDLMIDNRLQTQQNGRADWSLLQTQAQGLLFCSKVHDRVHGLASALGWHRNLTRLYDVPVPAFWQSTTVDMLCATKSLDMFAASPGGWHAPELEAARLPSWVPDFSRTRASKLPFCWPHITSRFNAAEDRTFTFDQTAYDRSQSRHLLVKGRQIGVIQSSVNFAFGNIDYEPDTRKYMQATYIFGSLAQRSMYPDQFVPHEAPPDELRRIGIGAMMALTASHPSRTSVTDMRIRGLGPESLYAELCWMHDHHDAIVACDNEDDLPLCFGRERADTWACRHFGGSWKAAMLKLREWLRICEGKIFVFGDGRDFGLAPGSCQFGDVVCVLHGSRVPIVLRKMGGCYRVIGQCYWHGWMTGDKVDWEEHEAHDFVLV